MTESEKIEPKVIEPEIVMPVLIESARLLLRRTEERDLAFVTEAESSPENKPFIGQWSLDEHREALTDPDMLHLIVQEPDGERIGYVIVTGLRDPNLSVCIKRIAIDAKGKGYGSEMLRSLRDWLFQNTGVHRLWLDVKTHNARAQHVYERAGFRAEGILRECIKVQDTFESLQIMSILREEYERLL
ncbi:ribosomal-protein-alanine N-acetyltransferase [compost metagenome]